MREGMERSYPKFLTERDTVSYTVLHIGKCLARFIDEYYSGRVSFRYDDNMPGSVYVSSEGLAHLIKTVFSLHGNSRYLYVKLFTYCAAMHLQFSRAEGFEDVEVLDRIEAAGREAGLRMRLLGDTLDFMVDIHSAHIIPVYESGDDTFYHFLLNYFIFNDD